MRTELTRNERIWRMLTVISILLAIFLMVSFTQPGAAIRGDSVRYVMTARNLIDGNGYSRISGGGEIYPETGFAPFLSFILAIFGLLRIDMYFAGRVLINLLYGLNMILLARIVHRFTSSWAATLFGSLLFISSSVIFEWHAWLMSEPLYIFLGLAAFILIDRYLETGSLRPLLLASFAVGAASLTRYIGLSLIPVGALSILFLDKGNLNRKLLRGVAFGALSLLPFVLWMVRNQIVDAGALANRELIFHPIRPEILRVYLFEMTSWFIPETITLQRILRASLALVAASIAPAYFVWDQLAKGRIRKQAPATGYASIPWQLLLYIPSYLAVLALNSFLLDAGTTYSGAIRYLMPLLVVIIILELMTAHYLIVRKNSFTWLPWAFALYALGIVVTSGLSMAQLAATSTLELGYTGIRTNWDSVVARLEKQSEEIPIISNNPEMVYYLVDRPAYMKPIKFDVYQQSERDDFNEQIELAKSRLAAGSIFVFFDEPSDEESEILRLIDVTPVFQNPHVTIYAYPDAE